MCHMSCVRCNLSHIKCHIIYFYSFTFNLFFHKVVKLFSEGSVINKASPYGLFKTTIQYYFRQLFLSPSCGSFCLLLLLDSLPHPETDVCTGKTTRVRYYCIISGDTVWHLEYNSYPDTTCAFHHFRWRCSHATSKKVGKYISSSLLLLL